MLGELIQRLFAVSSPRELRVLLKDHPDLERGELNEQLRALAAMPAYGAAFAAFVKLIEGIRARPEEAWSEYRRWKAEVERLEPEVESTRLAVLQALEDRDYDSVVAVAEEAARAAWSVGLGASAHSLLLSLGQAFIQRRSQDRAADLERAIEVLDVALALSVPNDVAAGANLGIAYLERVHGDVDANLDRASELFQAALERLPMRSQSCKRGCARTSRSCGCSITVANVTARSIRFPSRLRGRGAVPAVALIAYTNTPITTTPNTAINTAATPPPSTTLPRISQNAANAA